MLRFNQNGSFAHHQFTIGVGEIKTFNGNTNPTDGQFFASTRRLFLMAEKQTGFGNLWVRFFPANVTPVDPNDFNPATYADAVQLENGTLYTFPINPPIKSVANSVMWISGASGSKVLVYSLEIGVLDGNK